VDELFKHPLDLDKPVVENPPDFAGHALYDLANGGDLLVVAGAEGSTSPADQFLGPQTDFRKERIYKVQSKFPWIIEVRDEIPHEIRDRADHVFQHKGPEMPRQDHAVVEANRRRKEISPHEPRGILETMPVVRPHTTERRNESDPQPAPGTAGSLDIICRGRWAISQQDGQERPDIDTQFKGWAAHEGVDFPVFEILLSLRPLILANLCGMLCRDQSFRGLSCI
jgi:hypothetical protein